MKIRVLLQAVLLAATIAQAQAQTPAPKVFNTVYKCDEGKIVVVEQAVTRIVGQPVKSPFGPVAACDADFNALLVERTELTAALTHLKPICRGETHIVHPREDQ